MDTCVPSDRGPDSPLALRDGLGDRVGGAALVKAHAASRLPPMVGV
jgi:hypothetical protein